MTFYGKSRADAHTFDHAHEAPKVMIWPLFLLAIGAVVAGIGFYPLFVGHDMGHFWGSTILDLNDSIEAAHHVPTWVKVLPVAMGVLGIALAYVCFYWKPGIATWGATRLRPVYLFLLNKWYWDELYDAIFVRPAKYFGYNLWKTGDGTLIDGLGPDGVSGAMRYFAKKVSALQTGYLYHYAFVMLIGVVILISFYVAQVIG